MKYRIKETINNNSISTFTVQTKFLWRWEDSSIGWSSKERAEKQIRSWQTKEVKYHTVEQ
jgi:hypothetical protein